MTQDVTGADEVHDVTGCTVDPGWPEGITITLSNGLTIALVGSWDELADVGDAIAAVARDGAT